MNTTSKSNIHIYFLQDSMTSAKCSFDNNQCKCVKEILIIILRMIIFVQKEKKQFSLGDGMQMKL